LAITRQTCPPAQTAPASAAISHPTAPPETTLTPRLAAAAPASKANRLVSSPIRRHPTTANASGLPVPKQPLPSKQPQQLSKQPQRLLPSNKQPVPSKQPPLLRPSLSSKPFQASKQPPPTAP
jgi:hypothetical protein